MPVLQWRTRDSSSATANLRQTRVGARASRFARVFSVEAKDLARARSFSPWDHELLFRLIPPSLLISREISLCDFFA